MPFYILCAVGCSLIILFLSLKETVVPLIFMLGIFFPIAYNFGSNILAARYPILPKRWRRCCN